MSTTTTEKTPEARPVGLLAYRCATENREVSGLDGSRVEPEARFTDCKPEPSPQSMVYVHSASFTPTSEILKPTLNVVPAFGRLSTGKSYTTLPTTGATFDTVTVAEATVAAPFGSVARTDTV